MERGGYVYILTNKNNTVLYIGVTSGLVNRITEHKEFIHDGFTKRYIVTKLVYYEFLETIEEAILREKKLKNGSRARKINLIMKDNPKFRDVFDDLEDSWE